MITETIEVRGVELDIRHDTYVVEDIQVHDSQDDISPVFDVFLLAELKAILLGKKARIEEPVYEIGMMDNSPTLAEVNARRGYPRRVMALKTIEQIIRQEPVYLHSWAESKRFGVLADFFDCGILSEKEFRDPAFPGDDSYRREMVGKARDALEELKTVKILFASYTYEDYWGSAFVLLARDGRLYEVNGSHCSCFGLEGQWAPEETVLEELANRVVNGTFGREYSEITFAEELASFLGVQLKEVSP